MIAQKKLGQAEPIEHNKSINCFHDTRNESNAQVFRRELQKFIYEMDSSIEYKIKALEEVINFVSDKQEKLFATNLQAAYIARLAVRTMEA